MSFSALGPCRWVPGARVGVSLLSRLSGKLIFRIDYYSFNY